MAEGQKPYRLYRGGRKKGKVPLGQAKRPTKQPRTPGGPKRRRRWGLWVALALVGLLLLTLLWGLLVTNLIVVGFGGYVASQLAIEVRAPVWAGLAYALNPAIFVTVLHDGCDAVALGALLWSLLHLTRGSAGRAARAGILAALAKEASLLSLGGVALVGRGLRWRARAQILVLPTVAAAVWGVTNTLRSSRMGESSGIGSGSNTSRQATMRSLRSSAMSASLSTIWPRDTFTNTPPSRIMASCAAPSILCVAGVMGARHTTTSVSDSTCSSEVKVTS